MISIRNKIPTLQTYRDGINYSSIFHIDNTTRTYVTCQEAIEILTVFWVYVEWRSNGSYYVYTRINIYAMCLYHYYIIVFE